MIDLDNLADLSKLMPIITKIKTGNVSILADNK